MRPLSSRSRTAFAALGALAVAATALPLLPVWLADPARPAALPALASSVVVVDLRDDARASDIRDLETRYDLDLEANSIHASDDNLLRATLRPEQDRESLLRALRNDKRVEVAEPEVVFTLPETESRFAAAGAQTPRLPSTTGFVPNDPRYPEQWNLRMIGAEAAWKRSRGRGAVVAVIDTGVAAKNSDRGKQAKDFGHTRFARGYDFVHNDDDPYDDHGHGTHVAGSIAESTDNKEGVAGLAFEATVMPIKVLSATGSGTSTDVADAIRFAADKGAHVINLSLGSLYPADVVHQAVKYALKKNVVIVCAAGNGFGEPVNYPAAFPECIAVSSVGPEGELAFYSSYGKQVALAAPGGDMTNGSQNGILQNTVFPEAQGGKGDNYYHFQGTSMAAPHVAAAAALIVAQGVHDPARVRDLLQRSATPKKPELKYGAGVLSADKATAKAARQDTNTFLKHGLFAIVCIGFLVFVPRHGAVGLALAIGSFGPDWFATYVGANSAWNLLGFSAIIPFLLFWEMEDRRGSRIVGALSLGVGLCLATNLMMGLLPFTQTVFGDRPLPWVAANLVAALAIALAAWRRGSSSSFSA